MPMPGPGAKASGGGIHFRFDNEAGHEVFEFLATLFSEGLAPKGQTAQNRFFSGSTLIEQAGHA